MRAVGIETKRRTGSSSPIDHLELLTEPPVNAVDQTVSDAEVKYPLFPVLFLISLCVPLSFLMGTFRMSPYRVVLLISFAPAVLAWLSGRAGKITSIDLLFFGASFWAAIALFLSANFSEVYQTAAILFFETFGSYLLGRVYITNYQQFLKFMKFLFLVLLLLLPFAIFETLGRKNLPLSALSSIGNTFRIIDIGARMGLYRAQVVFEHPILWGVFASSLFGLITYTFGQNRGQFSRWGLGVTTAIASISSVSAGALLSLAVQLIIMGWDYFTVNIVSRWRILGGIVTALYVLVDLISNRTPFQVFITYLTFSAQSSFTRINIWTYGTAEVWRHPLFGIGLGDWVRPSYMGASMDNFWLATAVRYGLPTFLMLAFGVFILMRRMGKANFTNTAMASARAGLLTTYVGLIFAGCTVHYWNAMYCWIMFLFGLGHWCLNFPAQNNTIEVAVQEPTEKPSTSTYRNGLANDLAAKKSIGRVVRQSKPSKSSHSSDRKWLK